MKTIQVISLLILSTLSIQIQAEIKSAFINPSILLTNAPQAIEASKQMEKEFTSKEKILRELAFNVQKMEQDYKKDSAIMSGDQKKKMEFEILEKKRKLQFDKKALQDELVARRNLEIKKLQKILNETIKIYAEKNGYDFIFSEGVAYASKKVDITEDILKALGK